MSADEIRSLADVARYARGLVHELDVKRHRLNEISKDLTGFPAPGSRPYEPRPMRVWREGERPPPLPEPPAEVKAWDDAYHAAERARQARKDEVAATYRTVAAELETYREVLAKACARTGTLKPSEFRNRLTLVTGTLHDHILGWPLPDYFGLLQSMLTDLADWLDAKADDEERIAAQLSESEQQQSLPRFTVPLIAPCWRYDDATLADPQIRHAFRTINNALHDALRVCEMVSNGIRPEPSIRLRTVDRSDAKAPPSEPDELRYCPGDVYIFGLVDSLMRQMAAARNALKPVHQRLVCARGSIPPTAACGSTGRCAHLVAADVVARIAGLSAGAEGDPDLRKRWDIIYASLPGVGPVNGQ